SVVPRMQKPAACSLRIQFDSGVRIFTLLPARFKTIGEESFEHPFSLYSCVRLGCVGSEPGGSTGAARCTPILTAGAAGTLILTAGHAGALDTFDGGRSARDRGAAGLSG